jgi:hypothetical protein
VYSRNYYTEEVGKPEPPENYNGTVFIEQRIEEAEPTFQPADITAGASPEKRGLFSGLSDIPILSSLFGSAKGFSLDSIGIEEILIIATAAFLFFSKDGDKECALILLLILFIN